MRGGSVKERQGRKNRQNSTGKFDRNSQPPPEEPNNENDYHLVNQVGEEAVGISEHTRRASRTEVDRMQSNPNEFGLEIIATYSLYYLMFHDKDLQRQYAIHRVSDLATPLAVIMLFGCGGIWLAHCPKPNEIWLGGWYEAASLGFFIVYLLNISVFILMRLAKYYKFNVSGSVIQTIENWTRRFVPIGGALTCGLLLLARSIENRICTTNDLQFFNTYRCNPLAESHTFPAETALVCVIVPPFMQIVLKLDRLTTFICWLICWSCMIASTVVLKSYNVNFWFAMCGSSIPVVLYEVERQALVNYRLLYLQQVLSDRANSFRVKARAAMNDVESKELERAIAVKVSNELCAVVGHTAHDLKSPFTAMVLAVEALKSQIIRFAGIDPTTITEDIRREQVESNLTIIRNISKSLQYMEMSTSRSLDYARITSHLQMIPSCSYVNIQRTLQRAVEAVTWQGSTEISGQSSGLIVIEDIPDDVPTELFTDGQWFRHNLLCIIGNAIKYSVATSKNPHVIIRIQRRSALLNSSTAQRLATSDHIEISVQDSGPVLNQEDRDRIFETPTQEWREGVGGMGVGMVCLAHRVNACGGDYGCHPRDDGLPGLVVWFTLPMESLQNERDKSFSNLNRKFKRGVAIHPSTGGGKFQRPRKGQVMDIGRHEQRSSGSGGSRGISRGGSLEHRDHTDDILGHLASSVRLFKSKFRQNESQDCSSGRSVPPTQSKSLSRSKVPDGDQLSDNPSSFGVSRNSSENNRNLDSEYSNNSDGRGGDHIPYDSEVTHQDMNVEGDAVDLDEVEIMGRQDVDDRVAFDMRGMTALVVDDAISILKMISFILSKEGVTVSQAKNGKEAVDKMQQFIFDFVIMDIQMPVMNGFEAVKEVRRLERLSGSPPQTIIGISAQYDGNTVPSEQAEGFDMFLPKPFTMNSISEHLKSIKGASKGMGVLPDMVLSSNDMTPNAAGISDGEQGNKDDVDEEMSDSPPESLALSYKSVEKENK